MCVSLSLSSYSYVIDNVCSVFNAGFMGTRGVVKRLMQHLAAPQAVNMSLETTARVSISHKLNSKYMSHMCFILTFPELPDLCLRDE